MRSSLLLGLLIAFSLIAPAVPIVAQNNVGIHPDFPHARVAVTKVVDGDTIHISPPVFVAGAYRDIIRFADINAPELNTQEGQVAKAALEQQIAQYGSVVYLDIDKARGVDDYGRVVAVVYVRVDDNTLLNLNKWMIDNGYASIDDFADNDFDPTKWSLTINYPVTSEKIPPAPSQSIYTGFISYNTSWGIRTTATPDGKYLAIAYSEGSPYYTLHVDIVSASGLVKQYVFGPGSPLFYANVFRGMLDIAANETGFLVAWTNFTYSSYNRVVLYSYIPIDGQPTNPRYAYLGSYQYHPLVRYYPHPNGTKWWIVAYGYMSTTTSARIYFNILDDSLSPRVTGRFVPIGNVASSSDQKVGFDVMGKLVFDPVSNKVFLTARNLTSNDYDIIGAYGWPSDTTVISVSSVTTLGGSGDQGPNADTYQSTNYYSYFNLYPSIYTKLLDSGRYVLVVTNTSSTDLGYAVVDLSQNPPSIVSTGTLVSAPTTYYPWIAANATRWLVAWSGGGYVNVSLVSPTEGVVKSFTLASFNASYVRAYYDAGSGYFILVYGVTDYSGTRNTYVVLYNTTTDKIEPFAIKVSSGFTPLHVHVYPGGSPGSIAIVGLSGGSLVVYTVPSTYTEAVSPVPIPEWWIIAPVAAAGAVILVYTLRRRRR